MSWRISPQYKDPDYSSVSLLLHGNGTNGSTTITDNSPSPKTVTAVGNAQISTAIADPFGNSTRGVLAFDGTGDSLTIPGSQDFVFPIDFTVEIWVYPTNTTATNQNIINIDNFASGILIRYRSVDYSDDIYVLNAGGIFITPEIIANKWNHIALTRSGATVRAFVNGVVDIQIITVSGTVNAAAGSVAIGSSYTGYMSNIRCTKNVARYTANFTPPTAPFPDI